MGCRFLFKAVRDIPEGMRKPEMAGFLNRPRYLHTSLIEAHELPYATAIRPAVGTPESILREIPKQLSEIETAAMDLITEVSPVSHTTSGVNGLLRFGTLNDDRPVILKVSPYRQQDFEVLEEVQSVILLSNLGIGPRFHGLYSTPLVFFAGGRSRPVWNIVTDIVPGEFPNPKNITLKTLEDIDVISSRLGSIGMKIPPDFQPYLTADGTVQVIDGRGYLDQIKAPADSGHSGWNDKSYSNWTQIKADILLRADPKVAITYLDTLRNRDHKAFESFMKELLARPFKSQVEAATRSVLIRTYKPLVE